MPVAIAVLPSEVQVSPRLRAQVLERVQVAEADLDLEHPGRETRTHFEPEKCSVIDLLPALTAAEREEPTYALRNSHWNERGNAIAARQIADSLAPMLRERALARAGLSAELIASRRATRRAPRAPAHPKRRRRAPERSCSRSPSGGRSELQSGHEPAGPIPSEPVSGKVTSSPPSVSKWK